MRCKDRHILDTNDEIPYNFELKKEVEVLKKDDINSFKFATKKFERINGDIVALQLSLTKRVSSSYKFPTYCFDIVLHNSSNVIGNLTYSVVPDNIDGHNDNVSFNLLDDYNLKSVKYECCQLVKKVAEYHKSKILYLTCSPNDFATRKVYENI